MRFVVLAKVVPAADALRFDAGRRAVVRGGVPLFVNPLDQRAVRVALELRRAGEPVTVLSMGPPDAIPSLRECLAVGADRAVLVTDPRLAGSDTLVTARVLVSAIRRVGGDLVLGGRSSTDSDTGQVLAEVAALLDEPIVSSALTIARSDGSDELDLRAETPDGSAAFHLRPPAVIGVSEKIGKPLRPTPEGLHETGQRTVEQWSADDLGLPADSLGEGGSPTVVVELGEAAPERRPVVFDSGSMEERVERALERIPAPRALSHGATAETGRPVAPPGRADGEVGVLVTGPLGRLEPDALALVAHLRRDLAPLWPSAVWVGPSPTPAERVKVAVAGAEVVYEFDCTTVDLDPWSAASGIARLLGDRPDLAAVLFLSDPYGREVAGRVAGRRSLGLVGDAAGVRRSEAGELTWWKPAFGGGVVATIGCRTRPALATVRPGAFGRSTDGGASAAVTRVERSYSVEPGAVRSSDPRTEDDPDLGDLGTAATVVCVGAGVGGPEAVRSVRPHLATLGAALAATRKVVDAGWVPRQRQAGLTGRSLSPELVVLVGVRGTPNHLIAWRRAGTVVAINSDPLAPVFAGCDVGIVGDHAAILPLLVEGLSRRRGPASS